ncbi:MAG TPA: gamma-glutamyltransferase [Gemmatimonadaceae bacterium]|nr:gamma-glutamyltransferase [Gemmatimonadaceae bacterium]
MRRSISLLLLLLAACARPAATPMVLADPAKRAEAERGMVAAAHPEAVAAGVAMLRQGGNAVDAAVATAFALSVVEQQMAGLGGGGAMTMWMERQGRAEYLDFYATAGADSAWAAAPGDSAAPGRFVAVPGTVAGLLYALERHGTLSRDVVLAPAIRLAEEGFPVHGLLAGAIAANRAKLTRDSAVARIFWPNGAPLQAGDRLVQPELAATLRRIAAEGRDGFHRGPVAEAVVRALRADGSAITVADMAAFTVRERRPLCTSWRGYTLLSAPPPLDGAEVFQTLHMLEAGGIERLGLPSERADALALLVGATRLARADRQGWLGFPDDAAVPAAGMSSDAYARERLAVLAAPVSDSAPVGDPWDEERLPVSDACRRLDAYPATTLPRPTAQLAEPDGADEQAQTTHLSVVDADRNAVSLTFTAGVAFGSGSWAAGTFMNSAVANFGGPVANQRAAGRTPRSTIAPTIVLDADDVRLVVGSPGSSHIPPAIVSTTVHTLVFGLDPATALAMPRVYPSASSPVVELERGFAPAALAELRRRGWQLRVAAPVDQSFGGVHAILVRKDGTLVGAADVRRDGVAGGH